MKKVYEYSKTIWLILFSLTQIFAPIWANWIHGEAYYFEDWSADQTFTRTYAAEVEKDPNKDFVILNLTDTQLNSWDAYTSDKGKLTTAIIDKLVEENKPDLITVTGDNGWCTSAYLKLVKDLDKFGIPWAPVMGNHDGEGCISEFWCAYQLYKAKNCLFRFGPKDMGYGNYIINITENGDIVHTLFMMDTHADIREDNINGKAASGYDNLWANQIEWYKWAVQGIQTVQGHTVPSSVFIHIPLVEYKIAWNEHRNDEGSFGENKEPICSAKENNGFFAVCKALGSTENVICGHDHINSASIVYDGIRLTYGLKCGAGCYWDPAMSGGTVITVNNSDGKTTTEHKYIDLH